jgi:hypothetical protein
LHIRSAHGKDQLAAARFLEPCVAETDLDSADLFADARFACCESALCDAVDFGSRFKAATLLRDRFAEGF